MERGGKWRFFGRLVQWKKGGLLWLQPSIFFSVKRKWKKKSLGPLLLQRPLAIPLSSPFQCRAAVNKKEPLACNWRPTSTQKVLFPRLYWHSKNSSTEKRENKGKRWFLAFSGLCSLFQRSCISCYFRGYFQPIKHWWLQWMALCQVSISIFEQFPQI